MITAKNEKETFNEGEKFARGLHGNETVYLYGDVGAGKTVFTKGLAAGLGIAETIVSPTFTYFNIYESGRVPLYHFDLYRVKNHGDILELGIAEYLSADGVKVVEWPEILEGNTAAAGVTAENPENKPQAVKVIITKKGGGRIIKYENR